VFQVDNFFKFLSPWHLLYHNGGAQKLRGENLKGVCAEVINFKSDSFASLKTKYTRCMQTPIELKTMSRCQCYKTIFLCCLWQGQI